MQPGKRNSLFDLAEQLRVIGPFPEEAQTCFGKGMDERSGARISIVIAGVDEQLSAHCP